jgi:hypothetical protein
VCPLLLVLCSFFVFARPAGTLTPGPPEASVCLFVVFLTLGTVEWSCLTVEKGDYEPRLVPFYGFHSSVMTGLVRLAVTPPFSFSCLSTRT